jgi:hypothetical protein
MHEDEVVKISVNSWIMIDAAFFWKMDPNYSRPCTESGNFGSHSQIKSNGMEERYLLLCSPTVLGFGLGNKLWGKRST